MKINWLPLPIVDEERDCKIKAGTILKTETNEILLVGDTNKVLGICDDCIRDDVMFYSNEFVEQITALIGSKTDELKIDKNKEPDEGDMEDPDFFSLYKDAKKEKKYLETCEKVTVCQLTIGFDDVIQIYAYNSKKDNENNFMDVRYWDTIYPEDGFLCVYFRYNYKNEDEPVKIPLEKVTFEKQKSVSKSARKTKPTKGKNDKYPKKR